MSLASDIELANTRAKLAELEERHQELERETATDEHVRQVTMRLISSRKRSPATRRVGSRRSKHQAGAGRRGLEQRPHVPDPDAAARGAAGGRHWTPPCGSSERPCRFLELANGGGINASSSNQLITPGLALGTTLQPRQTAIPFVATAEIQEALVERGICD